MSQVWSSRKTLRQKLLIWISIQKPIMRNLKAIYYLEKLVIINLTNKSSNKLILPFTHRDKYVLDNVLKCNGKQNTISVHM